LVEKIPKQLSACKFQQFLKISFILKKYLFQKLTTLFTFYI